jgi:hypothetical protein
VTENTQLAITVNIQMEKIAHILRYLPLLTAEFRDAIDVGAKTLR